MSLISALTTFRLMGSPTKPGWPYCRPCCVCRSCDGEIAALGVGVGVADDPCCTWFGKPLLAATLSALIPDSGSSLGAAKLPMPQRHISNRTSVVLFVADVSRGK